MPVPKFLCKTVGHTGTHIGTKKQFFLITILCLAISEVLSKTVGEPHVM
jgi:hypothetical protein